MKLLQLSTVLTCLQLAAAHTLLTTLFVDDVDQGDGTCVRMPMTASDPTLPVEDLSSDDMACGFGGSTGVARVCPANKGSKLTFLFRENPDGSRPGAIDSSHKGPCAVYMKPVTSATNSTATGQGWSKIWDEGYDATTSQWCTEKLIQNNGLLSVSIPEEFAGGYYLVRTELLALHEDDKSPPDPQFYVGCAQVWLNSNATGVPKSSVAIPGYVSMSDPAVLFNIYTPKFPYTTPGPPPLTSNDFISNSNSTFNNVQSEGLLPSDAVLTNANWWGVELHSYTSQDGCWAASANCFDQETTCYNSAPPTGSVNCDVWDAKCMEIQHNCGAGNFTGPPNKGNILTPKPSVVYSNIPPAATQATATLKTELMRRRPQDGTYGDTTTLNAALQGSTVGYSTGSSNDIMTVHETTTILSTWYSTSTITLSYLPVVATASPRDQPAAATFSALPSYPTSSFASLDSSDPASASATASSTTVSSRATGVNDYLKTSNTATDVLLQSTDSSGISTSELVQAAAATSTLQVYTTSSTDSVAATDTLASFATDQSSTTSDTQLDSTSRASGYGSESDSAQAGSSLATSSTDIATNIASTSSSGPGSTTTVSSVVAQSTAVSQSASMSMASDSAQPASSLTIVTIISTSVAANLATPTSIFNPISATISSLSQSTSTTSTIASQPVGSATSSDTSTSTDTSTYPPGFLGATTIEGQVFSSFALPGIPVQSYAPLTSSLSSSSSSSSSSYSDSDSATASSTSSNPIPTNLIPTNDGLCGDGKTCAGTTWGLCCSTLGYCGNNEGHCANANCMVGYGECGLEFVGLLQSGSSSMTRRDEEVEGAGERRRMGRRVPRGLIGRHASRKIAEERATPGQEASVQEMKMESRQASRHGHLERHKNMVFRRKGHGRTRLRDENVLTG